MRKIKETKRQIGVINQVSFLKKRRKNKTSLMFAAVCKPLLLEKLFADILTSELLTQKEHRSKQIIQIWNKIF